MKLMVEDWDEIGIDHFYREMSTKEINGETFVYIIVFLFSQKGIQVYDFSNTNHIYNKGWVNDVEI